MKTNRKKTVKLFTARVLRIAILPILLLSILILTDKNTNNNFNQERALQDTNYQLSLGPRIIGSTAHAQFIRWATGELNESGWETQLQQFEWSGEQLTNIIATRKPFNNDSAWVILGAHYDSRFFSDKDPEVIRRELPVPGANDGASGVAVLLEIARSLPADINKNVWIVLFDAEDNGNIPGWEWIIGSRVFASQLEGTPDTVIIVDMVGDADLNIYKERNSDEEITNQIWEVASDLGYRQFISEYKHQILDDHVPFTQAGIPAIDIIDFDYPYWHTTQDTMDKISPASLDAVGEVLMAWLIK